MRSYLHFLVGCLLAVSPSLSSAQEGQDAGAAMPLSNTPSVNYYQPDDAQFSIAQQRAWFAAQQEMYRQEWFNWIGYSPLRPTVNASYMSSGYPRYFVPSRGVMINTGSVRSWYW